MYGLNIRLLGSPLVLCNGRQLIFNRRKVLALLVYLGVNNNPKSRDFLAQLFFPHKDRDHARSDLRQILSILKKKIGKEYLALENNCISLVRSKRIRIDVLEFRRLLKECRNMSVYTSRETMMDKLDKVSSLYQDEFLSGFYLKNNYDFENWQLCEQESLHKDYVYVIRTLFSLYKQAEKFDIAFFYGRKWVELDPLDERAHRCMMRLYALTNQHTASLKQYEKCKEMIKQELDSDPDEETIRLYKNIKERKFSSPAYRDESIILEKKSSDQNMHNNTLHHEPTETGSNIRANLPLQSSTFIGREKLIERIEILFGDKHARLVTLTGAPGSGKTRLAREMAERLMPHFPDGVFFVDLTSLTDPSQTVPAIARHVSIREPIEKDFKIIDIVINTLKNRKLLFVLDNFEHLLSAAVDIDQLIRNCPHLRIIVTSRESLHLTEEKRIIVPPLSIPLPGEAVSTYGNCEAVRLFIDRAKKVCPHFSAADDNICSIAGICIRLDGLPLAIELATTRLKIFTPRELLERLNERLDILKSNYQFAVQRHRTLYDEIDWSFRLLNDNEKEIFMLLSIFRDSFTLEAAESIYKKIDEKGSISIIDGLEALIEKHLLEQWEQSGHMRFAMLETICEYSRRKLRENGNENTLKGYHACYYFNMVKAASSELHGPQQMSWIERLQTEESNIREALTWFAQGGLHFEFNSFLVLLYWYWYRSGKMNEGTTWLELGLQCNDYESVEKIRPYVVEALAFMMFFRGDWNKALQLFRECLVSLNEQEDMREQSTVLSYLGVTERWLGHDDIGTRHIEEALRISRELGDTQLLATALIASYSTTGGRLVSTEQKKGLEEAFSISDKYGYLWTKAHALNGLGDLCCEQKEFETARLHYEASLESFRELKDDWLIAWNFEGLARVSYFLRQLDHAYQYTKDAIHMFFSVGDKTNTLYMFPLLVIVERARKNHFRAAVILSVYDAVTENMEGRRNLGNTQLREELEAAFLRYRSNYTFQWQEGRTMTFEETVDYILSD